MKKTKKITKRLLKRSREMRSLAGNLTSGDRTLMDRARLFADVLQEVADQIHPRSRKQLHKELKRAAKTAKKNGTHDIHVGRVAAG